MIKVYLKVQSKEKILIGIYPTVEKAESFLGNLLHLCYMVSTK